MICQVNLTSYNLSSDLKRGKRAGWQVNLSNQIDKLTGLSSGTCHRRWKLSSTNRHFFFGESLACRRRCLRDFPVIFLRVLVCLKSVFSDGQDVKYDRDITPHPNLFHGTNSHEHSAHRDNRVNKTWKWRGRNTQLIVRGMSRLMYCLQIVAQNPPTL
jgi:hypothetical protein